MGTRKICVHCTYNLGSMLPLGSPSKAGSPRVEDLVESAFDGEGEWALEERAPAWPVDQDRGELL